MFDVQIFVYVMAHADIDKPATMAEFCSILCDQDSIIGERGYYLTVFQSALEYIRRIPIDKVSLGSCRISAAEIGLLCMCRLQPDLNAVSLP